MTCIRLSLANNCCPQKGSTLTYSPLANLNATREVLDRFGLGAKYSLGQNFLIDDNIIGRILDASGLLEADGFDRDIIEIGPGVGTLTVALLDHARVASVEFDKDLPPVLAEATEFNGDRFALIQKDALKVCEDDIRAAFASIGGSVPSMLVSNLPYAVAATVILDWFEKFDFLQNMTVMVQSEVADRIAAQKGTKDYAAYTIKLRMFAQTTKRFQVSPNCFYPAPRVESAVIRLDRHELCQDRELLKAACRVADAAFAQRRKNIRNSMKSHFDAQVVDALLGACDIDPKLRGEALDVEQYLQLGAELLKLQNQ